MIDLIKFLMTGELLGIHPGDSEADVLNILGAPELYEPAGESTPAYAQYDAIEIRFLQGRIIYIGLSVLDCPRSGDGPACLGDSPVPTFDQVIHILREAGISAFLDRLMSDDQQTVVITDRKVHMVFDEDDLLGKVVGVWNDEYTASFVMNEEDRLTDGE